MEPDSRITGKVAQIISQRELAINVGSNDGVTEGMKFAVLATKPIEVRDPDSNEIIGSVDRVKVRVQAIDVQEQMTVCITYRSRTTGGELSVAQMLAGWMRNTQQRVYETFEVSDSEYPPITEEEIIVSRGDRVIEIDDSLD